MYVALPIGLYFFAFIYSFLGSQSILIIYIGALQVLLFIFGLWIILLNKYPIKYGSTYLIGSILSNMWFHSYFNSDLYKIIGLYNVLSMESLGDSYLIVWNIIGILVSLGSVIIFYTVLKKYHNSSFLLNI